VQPSDQTNGGSGLTLIGLPLTLFNNARAHGDTGLSAMIAYNFFLALPVAAIFFVTLLGIVPGIDIAGSLHDQLEGVVPDEGLELIEDIVSDALEGGEGLLIISLIGTFYVLNNGYTGLITSLNRVYELEERRSWLKVRLRALVLSVFTTGLLIATFAFVTIAPLLVEYLSDSEGAPRTVALWLDRLRWPAIIILGILAIEATYRYCPCGGPRWRFVSPGTLVAEFAWVFATLGFGYYVNNFASYDRVYGTLAAVVILLVWLWMSAMTFLIGGEINKLWHGWLHKGEAPRQGEMPGLGGAAVHVDAPEQQKNGAPDV